MQIGNKNETVALECAGLIAKAVAGAKDAGIIPASDPAEFSGKVIDLGAFAHGSSSSGAMASCPVIRTAPKPEI